MLLVNSASIEIGSSRSGRQPNRRVRTASDFITIDIVENNRDPDRRRRTALDRRHSTSRERVLREVEAVESACTAELVAATGLHPNTVRAHLTRLEADGYIRSVREPPAGRGRPAIRWTAVDQETTNPYAGLAEALADTVGGLGPDAPRMAQQAGFAWGERIAEQRPGPGTTRELLLQVASEQGFDPEDTGEAVLLRQCPLRAAADRRPEVVCAVHAGLLNGVSHARGDGTEVSLQRAPAPCPCVVHIAAVA